MRRNLLKPLFTCLLLLGSIIASLGQTQTIFRNYTDQWRFIQTGAAAPANWFATNFVDDTWNLSPGVHGYPINENLIGASVINTMLNAESASGTQIQTYYFRATFTNTIPVSNLIVTAFCLIDDGALFYINGRLLTNRPGMGPGAVTYNTAATRGNDISDRGLDTFTIASSNFVQGVNTVAVELHQTTLPSSDAVFGMRLVAQVLTPVTITQQPQDQTVDAGLRATFNVEAQGTGLQYQWFLNNVPIQNATNDSYQTPVTSLAHNGRVYHVVVSNPVNSLRSSNAVLSVVVDDSGPLMTDFFLEGGSTNRVRIQFNESLATPGATHPTITNFSNFTVYELGTTNKIAVTNIVFGITQLRLTLNAGVSPEKDYILCVQNMEDTKGNFTANDCIGMGVTVTTNVVSFGDRWRWDENERVNEPTNSALGVTWKDVGYNDDPALNFMWAEDLAPLGADFNFTGVVCESHPGSGVSRSPVTHYMRKEFIFDDSAANATITLRHTIDDGAVFYINGAEIHRVNLPAGPITYSTFAPTTNEARCATNVISVGDILRPGANVFAVELHQANEIASAQHDVWFDAEMSITYRRAPLVPRFNIDLAYTYQTNNNVVRVTATNAVLTWLVNRPGWRLQHATNIAGPWAPIGVSGNRYTTRIPDQGPRRYYRMVNP